MPIHLLCSGSRRWTDRAAVRAVLVATPRGSTIIHGGAPGLDEMVDAEARAAGFAVRAVPARWAEHAPGWCTCAPDHLGEHCPGAGPRRNQQMLDEYHPTHLAAFPLPDSRGTWDMVSRGREAGVRMVCRVYTGRIGSRDPDEVVITRQHAADNGLAFAPSWGLLNEFKARERAEGKRTDAAWMEYYDLYVGEMRQSYRTTPDAWTWLLSRPRVVLACVCPADQVEKCHRTVLGREILPRLGAVYCGEIATAPRPTAQARLF